MTNIIIENLIKIAFAFLMTLIGVLGTWLTIQMEKTTKLGNVQAAVKSTINMAQLTAQELQQTVVDGLKHANTDNKLTKDEIAKLGEALIAKTLDKLDAPTTELLNGVGVDISALITGAGEAWIQKIKGI